MRRCRPASTEVRLRAEGTEARLRAEGTEARLRAEGTEARLRAASVEARRGPLTALGPAAAKPSRPAILTTLSVTGFPVLLVVLTQSHP
jgi:hypothetical protein